MGGEHGPKKIAGAGPLQTGLPGAEEEEEGGEKQRRSCTTVRQYQVISRAIVDSPGLAAEVIPVGVLIVPGIPEGSTQPSSGLTEP